MPSQNLIVRSSDVSHAAWGKNTGVTVTGNTVDVTDPLGTNLASKVVYDGSGVAGALRLYQAFTTLGPAPYARRHVQRWWMRTASGTVQIRILDGVGGELVTVDTTWRAFEATTESVVGNNYYAMLASPAAVNTGFTVYVWRVQAEQGNAPGDYVETVAAAINVGAPANRRVAQNLLVRASDITQSDWSKTNVTAASVAGVAPDGSAASRITDNVTNASHAWTESGRAAVAGRVYTLSAYFKYENQRYVLLAGNAGDATAYAYLDLQLGVVNSVTGANVISSGAKDIGGGWVRYWVTYLANANATAPTIYFASAPGTTSYAGTGSNTALVWGQQLEQSNAPGDLVNTGANVFNIGAPPARRTAA